MARTILLLPLLLMSCGRTDLENRPIRLEELRIEVFGKSRELGYTNKQAGFFYTETNAEHRTGWQGWHIMSRKILNDYLVSVDGKPLRKSDVHLSIVSPHQFQRAYPIGVQETVTLLDSVDAIVMEYEKIKGTMFSLRPLFSDSRLRDDYEVELKDHVLLVANKNHMRRSDREDYPVWLGLVLCGAAATADLSPLEVGTQFGPAEIRAHAEKGTTVAVLVAGDSKEQTVSLARFVSGKYRELIDRRKVRMEQLLNRAYVRTDNKQFDKALHWALLSMDALVMSQGKKGIFAGLPWFSNYWGRDSFLSLPGSSLVTGNFSDARDILRSFAEWQDKNPKSPTFGRIPNLVTPASISYNTTDGTPWFVIALTEYVSYSNDLAFARELYPVVKRSIEGSLKGRVDKGLLLTHEDAETWMDAVGPNGPWSPRGSRANDIQSLWYRQLVQSSWLAELLGDTKSAQSWFLIADRILRSFNSSFIDTTLPAIHDHLNDDNSADRQFRPNQLMALDLVDDVNLQEQMFRKVTERLVYVHGVASLWQEDPAFHPFHHYEPYYVQDAAYHNGIVWTWLAGPWIDAATRFGYQDLAYQVTDNMVHQILDHGAVGTLSELLDAAPRADENEPRLSGTFTQAWSLAEFIRVFYQDYAGVTVDAVEGRIRLNPRLPSTFRDLSFNVTAGSQTIRITYNLSRSEAILTATSPPQAATIDLVGQWQLPVGVEHNFAYMLAPNTTVTITIDEESARYNSGSGEQPLRVNILRTFDPTIDPGLELATPLVRSDLAALRGPSHRLLTNAEIKVFNPGAAALVSATDPEKDDRGPGTYTYPTTPLLKPGSLDITAFNVSADERNVYFRLAFRGLSNPDWHPEYGFQLTYAAIAIDKDGKAGSGARVVGRNANLMLPKNCSYESVIFVGGGIRVEDSGGGVIAEYLPVPGDQKDPLGNISTKTISFAVPTEILGRPQPGWKFAVAVGAQDDHGGSGIGEFRSVGSFAKEWVGGGKKSSADPNVYDTILPR